MKIGRGFRPNQYQNYDIQFFLMVTWADWLSGLNHVTTVREVRKQLNYLTTDEVYSVHFYFLSFYTQLLALKVLIIYLMLYAQFE